MADADPSLTLTRALPTGVVTFLFTDVEASTRLLQAHPDAYRRAVRRHHDLLEAAVTRHGGTVFETVGDAVYAAFTHPAEAVAAALDGQRALAVEDWGEIGSLRVRMGIHLGDVEKQGDHYFGAALYRCARLMSAAHGGQVVLSEAAAALVRDELPAGAVLKDTGEHVLKDLARPERIFELLHPDLPADLPALRTLDTLPNNLPIQLTSFIGREKEMAEGTRLLGAARLLTLSGAGGSGKTRLALQLAADTLEDFPDGVWLVELAPLTEPAQVAKAVAAVLSVAEQPGVAVPDSLVDALRSRHVLLVLDNCEHLLDACARLADRLLRACPKVQLLCTSREPLGTAGETTWRVPSLGLPQVLLDDAVELAAALSQYEAVRLFVDRAVAVMPGFQVTNENAPAVAQLCHRLDGIPLAIELAAARLRGLSVDQLSARLDQRFRLLTGGSRTALPRQQTLQAAVDWSYGLLSEQEKTLFNRLSVFAGGWTVEAAEAVCAGAPIEDFEVLDLLLRLVDKSLVLAQTSSDTAESVGGVQGEERYRLLETLRQYGRERLVATGEAEEIHTRHAAHFDNVAEDIRHGRRKVAGGRPIPWFRREHENLRAALQWLTDTGDVERGLRLGAITGGAWVNLGHFAEGKRRLNALFALPGADARTELRVRALHALAGLHRRQAEYDVARPLFDEALAIAHELGDVSATRRAALHLANFAFLVADYDAAEAYVAQARALPSSQVQEWGLPRDPDGVFMRGQIAMHRGEYAGARGALEQAIALARANGERTPYGEMSLSHVARAEGRLEEAWTLARGALELSRSLGDMTHVAHGVEAFAGLIAIQGDPERALRVYGAARALRRRLGVPNGPAWQGVYDRELAGARAALGPEMATAAEAAGELLTLDQALALALESAPAA